MEHLTCQIKTNRTWKKTGNKSFNGKILNDLSFGYFL